MRREKSKRNKTSIFIHLFFIIFAAACFLPLVMVVSASFTSASDLAYHGFSLLPPKINLTAYKYIFTNPKQVIDAYKVTIFITVVGTFLGILVMTMVAYALSRPRYKLKKIITWYLFLPNLFGGGLVASYIVNTKYLHMADNVWIMILPGLCNVYHVFMLRTFFQQLPDGLFDSARIDGAGEWRIYSTIALMLSKPIIATVGFLGALVRWNEWYSGMLYMRKQEKRPLQYLLQRMMLNAQEILNNMDKVPAGMIDTTELPGDDLKMAMLVVCIGPMMLIFPFFQKYFTKGMTVGSIKG